MAGTPFALISGAMPTLQAILSPDGVVLDANRWWEDVLGIPPHEMIGRYLRELVADGHEHATYAIAVTTGRSEQVFPLRRRSDGATIHIQLSTKVIELDGEIQVLAIGGELQCC